MKVPEGRRKRILLVDRLRGALLRRPETSLRTYDEIWTVEAAPPIEHPRIHSIYSLRRPEVPLFWDGARASLELCDGAFTAALAARLRRLSPWAQPVDRVYKRFQALGEGELATAGVVRIFVRQMVAEGATVDYVNNHLWFVHEALRKELTVLRRSKWRRFFGLLYHLGRGLLRFLGDPFASVGDLVEREGSGEGVLLYLDQGQQGEEFVDLVKAFRTEGEEVTLFLAGSANDLPPTLRALVDEVGLVILTPRDLSHTASFPRRLWRGGLLFCRSLGYAFGDPTNAPFYCWCFEAARHRGLMEALARRVRPKRFLSVGEYQPTFNIRSALFHHLGAVTETIVHGVAKPALASAYLDVDRLFGWARMKEAYEAMGSRIASFRNAGSFYADHVESSAATFPRSEKERLVLVFTQHLDKLGCTDFGWDWRAHKKLFLSYVLRAAQLDRQTRFLILPHPMERRRGYVDRDLSPLLAAEPNVTLSDDVDRFASYKYIRDADLGVTINSGIGYEMLFAGGRCIFFETDVATGYMADYQEDFGELVTSATSHDQEAWAAFLREIMDLPEAAFAERFPRLESFPGSFTRSVVDADSPELSDGPSPLS